MYKTNEVKSHIKLNEPPEPNRPSLRAIFEKHGLHKSHSNHPRAAKGSYHFFCWLLEREKPHEKSIEKTIIDKTRGERKAWVWPYATRLIVNSLAFLKLSKDDQRYIVAAREDGIFWRGDEINFFRTVYDETMLWRGLDSQGKAEHIAKAKSKFAKGLEV